MTPQGEVFIKALSRLLGWIYAFCWSASFYPQPILNYRRRSTHGLAIDFPATNTLGFICYMIYALAFLYSPLIREQYAARHPISPEPTVRFNDVAFTYALSYVKLIITIIKYIPQAWVNYKRKSTVGWSISAILLDFTGGILSVLQLLIDSAFEDDWSGITGNPIKLLLGNVSVFFDIIFILQHYIIYRGKWVGSNASGVGVRVGAGAVRDGDEGVEGASAPLLGDRASRDGGRSTPRVALP
ncbi:hypothetical protein I7I51_03789 [Histoplasma capsulatum]|uniref:Cystinosin n=1 Tax=Ajellomyces capsulatus TaxID=5037 RepID=A0A8A1MAU5_AJECA|nr:hypothetical protein I7I51_03789 [Histoplasma capsulatum]